MERNSRVELESLDNHRVADSSVSDIRTDNVSSVENRDASRSSDNRRRIRLRLARNRRSRNSESRDSDESTESRADESTNESESAEKNTVRVEQYFANETNKSKNRKSDRKTASKSVNLDVVVAQVVETTFNVVSMLTNEQHWALDASERDLLSDAVVSYIEAQDRRTLQRMRKIAGKYFPAVNLAIVSFAIIYPRILQSKIFLKKV